MNEEGLDALLKQLSNASDETVSQLYERFAPLIQMVIRRLLPDAARRKLDSEDVVDSVWADVVQGLREDRWTFNDSSHFQAFLLRLARNRLFDRLRENRSALSVEVSCEGEPLSDEGNGDPFNQIEAADLWEKIQRICPPRYRLCLRLRREGHTYSEIAEQTGIHASTIRRVFYSLAREMCSLNERADQIFGSESQ